VPNIGKATAAIIANLRMHSLPERFYRATVVEAPGFCPSASGLVVAIVI
jgi:hypothetical protein